MIRVHDVIIDLANVPLAVRTAETAIDTFLTVPAWLETETERVLTVTWANFGGITLAKARGLVALLEHYRRVGRWDVRMTSTNDTTWTIAFAR